MTLAERRVVNEFEINHFPSLKTRVENAAGFALPLEISWDTLAVAGESHLYVESWTSVYFEPLIAALEFVARDDMGRDAIKNGLKKVVIQNTKACTYGDCWAAFDSGVLTLDHESVTNAYDVEGRKKGLITVLEQNL